MFLITRWRLTSPRWTTSRCFSGVGWPTPHKKNYIFIFTGNNDMSFKRKPLVVALAAILILAGAGSLLELHGNGDAMSEARAQAAPPAAEVDVATVLQKNITDWQSYSGRLQAIDHVDVCALVPGTIMAVYFKDGALVKKGDPLFLIDPRPYVAAVDQADAQLAAARARASFATTDYARAQKLITDNAIAKRDFDQKANDALEANANVKAAQAALENAQINLGYTRITAPVAGRVSRAEITVGNVIAAGVSSPALTTLVSVSPIYASFDVDEQTYLQYLSRDSKKVVPVRLGLVNESGYSRTGRVASVDNQLDSNSGTIRVRATFDNADGALVPGLYARVAVGGGEPHPALLIDDRAVSTDQAKKFVLVVDAQNHAQYREVTQGNMYEGLRVITAGLQPGERIVVSGLQRVRPGSEVKPNLVPMSGENTAAQSS
jgi:membrane fusion protein, multidrug efflux system